MKSMAVAKFKEQCLSVLSELDSTGLIITKRGVPVARVMPIRPVGKELLGSLKGSLKISGDIMSTGIQWNAES
jgi:prevent-host-death family protein